MAKKGNPVDIYSMEMTSVSMANRGMANGSGVNYYQIRTAKIDQEQSFLINESATEKGKLPIWIDDTGRTEIDTLLAKIRYNAMRHKTKVVIIDHIGYVYSEDEKNLVYAIGVITKKLKSIAKELNTVMVILCQLNRSKESNEDKRPELTSLRYSGEIEQDADVVIGLHREDYYNSGPKDHRLEVLILKGRDSGTGKIEMGYDYSRMQIYPLSEYKDYF
jgi:replicative DNA helicase